MLDGRGKLRRPLPPPPPPSLPPGRAPGHGGAAGGRLQVPQALAGSPGGRNKGGGGGLSPSPPSISPPSSSQGLADIFGNISRQLTMARAGVQAPGVGTGRPPGVADLSSRGGGGRRSRLTPSPQGMAPGGTWRRRPPRGRGSPPPSPGAATGHQGESLPPSPPQKRAQRAGGKRVGQPRRRPMQTPCDEHRAPACKSCKGHRGVWHWCSRHHEGHPL